MFRLCGWEKKVILLKKCIFVCLFWKGQSLTGTRPQTHTFLKAHYNSYSSTAMEHKYKDKDNYTYKDKDGDAKTITGILTVCYIFGILMTRQMCSNLFKCVSMCSNLLKLVQNLFKCVKMCSNLFKIWPNVFKYVQMCSNMF